MPCSDQSSTLCVSTKQRKRLNNRRLRQSDTKPSVSNHTTRKKTVIIKDIVLHDKGGDLAARWYIEYYKCNLQNGKKERCREWISKKLDATERNKFAQKRIEQLSKVTKEVSEISIDKIRVALSNLINDSTLRKKSKSTYMTCVKQLCLYLEEYTTITNIREINKDIAIDFLESLTVQYHPNTITSTRNHLSSTFGFAIDEKYITENPFQGIKLRLQKDEGDFNTPFSDYEKQAIEDYLIENNYKLYLFTRFVFYAFLRPKELRHITVGDIDLKLKTIKIKSDVSKTNSRDIIPILKPLYSLIVENELLKYPSSYYLFGKGLMPSAEKLPDNLATSLHKEVLEELDIYKERVTTLYAWKHTGNIHAYLAGMDIKMIQRINRHKSLATTEIYLKKLGLFLDKTVFDFSY